VGSSVYRYRVCVADDCPDVAAVLSEGLRLHDYDTEVAHDGETALAICAQGNIDLVLLDVCMPGIDGYEVCRRLKASATTQDIPVIFVTVKGSPSDIAQGRSLGAVDYITKPYNLPMVMLRVGAALHRTRPQDRLRVHRDTPTAPVFTDHLTGLRTRPYLLRRLQEEVDKGGRHNFPVSCAVFDVDDVRALDGAQGAVSMDELLVDIAIILRNQARTCDILARCDVTEFAAVLPHTSLEEAVAFGTRMMNEVALTTFADPTKPTQATLCSGIVTCPEGLSRNADFVFRDTMCRLFEAKSMAAERIVARHLTAA